ncbi:nucleoplasmin-2-like [Pteronotus mesoamericanus]|uniref:nucleoplasmin-2-like n=1 Tax=Pteronotus mesoamericanus TaxID=1884717 RepID=UPI0023ED9220|nr:nucleoplasmin-2-like [Pteronotus parnellii mesoamericanus]
MNHSRTTSIADRAATATLWGCELNQERRTWTFKSQKEGKQDCKVFLNTVCLGEKAKEEVNLVEVLSPASQEDKRAKPVTIASLQASVLPTVSLSLQARRGWAGGGGAPPCGAAMQRGDERPELSPASIQPAL